VRHTRYVTLPSRPSTCDVLPPVTSHHQCLFPCARSFGGKRPHRGFISILQDPTEEADPREDLVGLLGQFGERVPLEVLIAAVGDSDPAICGAAMKSLSAQGPRAPLEPIIAHT
jgi:hypothetical protein